MELQELIQGLNQINPSWVDDLEGEFSDKQSGDVRGYLNEILGGIRDLLRSETKTETEKQLRMLIDSKKTIKILMELAERTLIYYRAMEPIRIAEKNNTELMKSYLLFVFDKCILRVDTGLAEKYSNFDIKSEKEFMAGIHAVRSLTEYYVRRRWTRKTVENDFREETGLSETLCAYYSDLFEKNYQELKLNAMLDSVDILQDMLEEFMEESNV